MNQLFFPRIISEFNIYFANSIWIDLQSTIPLAESRWIYYPFHFITVNTLTASRFYYVFTICSANSPCIRIHLESFSQIHYEYNICFTNSLSNSRMNEEFTMNSLSFSRFHFELTILFPKSLWMHYCFREINMNSQSASRFYYVFTICSANSPWIHYPFLGITLNLLSFSLHHCENTIYFAISLWIHYIFRESRIVKSDIFLRTQFESALFIANLLRIMTHKWRYAYVTDRIIT